MRKILVPCLLLGLLYAGPAFATATGLNNIPTADVVPEKVLVLQYYGNFASGAGPDHFLGFKYEKSITGCCQCTIAAIQDALDIRNDDEIGRASCRERV